MGRMKEIERVPYLNDVLFITELSGKYGIMFTDHSVYGAAQLNVSEVERRLTMLRRMNDASMVETLIGTTLTPDSPVYNRFAEGTVLYDKEVDGPLVEWLTQNAK